MLTAHSAAASMRRLLHAIAPNLSAHPPSSSTTSFTTWEPTSLSQAAWACVRMQQMGLLPHTLQPDPHQGCVVAVAELQQQEIAGADPEEHQMLGRLAEAIAPRVDRFSGQVWCVCVCVCALLQLY